MTGSPRVGSWTAAEGSWLLGERCLERDPSISDDGSGCLLAVAELGPRFQGLRYATDTEASVARCRATRIMMFGFTSKTFIKRRTVACSPTTAVLNWQAGS